MDFFRRLTATSNAPSPPVLNGAQWLAGTSPKGEASAPFLDVPPLGAGAVDILFDCAPGLAFEVDFEGRFHALMPRAALQLEFPPEFFRSQTLFDIVCREDHQILRAALSSGSQFKDMIIVRMQRGLGEVFWVRIWGKPSTAQRPASHFVIWVQDITELKESELRLERLTSHDPLTGLGNRVRLKQSIADSMSHASASNTAFAVTLLDLDGFKKVNDSLGHGIGDELLIAAAQRLREAVRRDDVVTRMGGDEFVVVLAGPVNETTLKAIVDRILTAIERPFVVGTRTLRVTTSIGVAVFPEHGRTEAALLQHADLAMYRAKSQGKNRFEVFSDELLHENAQRVSLESDMFDGIYNGEFFLKYQPIVDLKNNALRAVEALMRWTRNGKAIPPSEFIPLAEENGSINLLGEWALRTACMQLALWDKRGFKLPYMSVNISPRQFMFSSFPAAVAQALSESGITGDRLMLEITETTLAQDPEHAIRMLTELQYLGVRFAVDDFGTGYSSLAYLKMFPLSVLKIDRTFIRDMPNSKSDQAIVAAVLGLARELGLSTTAEGVETEQHRKMLIDLGCTAIQGYLFSEPMSAREFERRLLSGRFIIRENAA